MWLSHIRFSEPQFSEILDFFLFIQTQFSEQKVFPKSSLGCMYFYQGFPVCFLY